MGTYLTSPGRDVFVAHLSGMKTASRPLLWVALGASLWGTDTVLRRPLTAVWPSLRIVLLEHVILCLALLPVLWRSRAEWRRLRGRQWAAVLGVGWGGSALGTLCFTEAIRLGNPTVAVLLQKSQPVFAALLAHALLGEPLGWSYWRRLALALGGVYLLTFGNAPLAPWSQRGGIAPSLLALAAAALWGSATVLGRFILDGVSFSTLTALRIFSATPLLALLALGSPARAPASAHHWLLLLGLALAPGFLGLMAYYRGLQASRAAMAAIAELSFPATAALLNWTLLGASVTALELAGFAVLWIAILSLNTGPRGTDQE
jgi:drug/metabolite transporter (DMT)-like permease